LHGDIHLGRLPASTSNSGITRTGNIGFSAVANLHLKPDGGSNRRVANALMAVTSAPSAGDVKLALSTNSLKLAPEAVRQIMTSVCDGNVSVKIYNTGGIPLQTIREKGQFLRIPLNLPAGVYILQINLDRQIKTGKAVTRQRKKTDTKSTSMIFTADSGTKLLLCRQFL
jgi:hypothetical protein